MNDNDILNFINSFKCFKYISLTEEHKRYLLDRYNDFYSINEIEKLKEAIYRIKNNIEIIPKCPICGKPVKFSCNEAYNKYLSICGDYHCLGKLCNEKRSKTFIEKYHIKSNLSRKEVQENIKKSMIEKYGVDNIWKTDQGQEKCRNTIIKNHGGLGAASKDIKEKMENTMIKKYGWKHNWQDPEEQKRSHSDKAKAKQKQTCLERYGVDNIMKSPEHLKKREMTWIKKYGVTIPTQNKLIMNKVLETKSKNHTHNTSQVENESEILLKEKFIDVKRNYKSTLYPYMCDFYIPNLDLYIECNYHWTHGDKPYNENDQYSIDLINLWKSRNTQYYNNAITTFTIRDVNKRNIAKQNKLNYKEFFNINEFKNWINEYK